MSLWWRRDEHGRRSLYAVEGFGFGVCLALVLAAALIVWIVS